MSDRLFGAEFEVASSGAYGFHVLENEAMEDAVIRAADVIIKSGINEIGLSQGVHAGTNKIMAQNAALAFSKAVMRDLKSWKDPLVSLSAEMVELYQRKIDYSQREAAAKTDFIRASNRERSVEVLAQMQCLKPQILKLRGCV